MERIEAINQLLNDKKIDKLHIEYWEQNEEDDDEHLVKINAEKEYF